MTSATVEAVLDWYTTHARDLPWRWDSVTPWGVLVSEVMLQQTPVARVVQPWQDWLRRWPAPADLAREPSGAAVAAWGRLGYPRRALRLHAAAQAIVERHGGQVPRRLDDLLGLPGVGEYTAAAVASFGYGQRHLVLDTNARRLLARLDGGTEHPGPSLTVAERDRALRYLPRQARAAVRWAVASMELGALVCTARSPGCPQCPLAGRCAWLRAGCPAGPARRGQPWQGTDRQCRGVLLGAVRDRGPTVRAELLRLWPDRAQAEACLASLLADGLLHGDTLVRL
ncbi:MAG: A/G-specific adenine glycosylase [Actinomycetia bacterium]|nr:A/G-specific adenine glycosylase [Actinomycetes bacterium]